MITKNRMIFAHYYIGASDEETKEMGILLNRTKRYAFEDYEAFDMLYEKVRKKFELCVVFPFLKIYFRGKRIKMLS